MRTQAEKAMVFRALHEKDDAFIIPNPWDIGTARLLELLGFEALATTSAGYAFSVGRRDNTVGRGETIAHAAAIVSATDLPVSADLENGFCDDPATVAVLYRCPNVVCIDLDEPQFKVKLRKRWLEPPHSKGFADSSIYGLPASILADQTFSFT